MTFACNPDESAGFSEKVCRYVVYECWEPEQMQRLKRREERPMPAPAFVWERTGVSVDDSDEWTVVEIAECDTKEAIGTMLVQLADDRAEIDSPAKMMALWDRLEERWITGTP